MTMVRHLSCSLGLYLYFCDFAFASSLQQREVRKLVAKVAGIVVALE
jgi:hypothetical protein